MNNVRNSEIIYKAAGSPDIECIKNINEKCFVCGSNINEGCLVNEIIGAKFTNFDVCKDINSKFVCKECSFCMKEARLRKSNFIACESKIIYLKKDDLATYLFNLNEFISTPFVVGVTRSFKKHNSFRCRVNYDINNFYIREEDKEYLFNVDKMKYLYQKLNEAYLHFSKEELRTGNYSVLFIEQLGINKFNEYENLFKKYRRTYQFELLIYIMDSAKKKEYLKEKKKLEKLNNKSIKNKKVK
ncbi:hypothetical protein KWT25_03600 [Clostridioides difficile]|nr:hypothetical protein [Clostridioides difficile]HBE8429893.1 hypothetical protein [Clostridioides difficile]